MMRLWMVVLGVPLAGCGPVLGGQVCTLMDAPSQLRVHLDGEADVPGDYAIEVEAAGRVVASCEATVPLAESFDALCGTRSESRILGQPGAGLDGLILSETVDELTVRVFRDGEELVEETFAPDYEEDEPNGKGCGVRRTGEITLTW